MKEFIQKCEAKCAKIFASIDEIALRNQQKILTAFQENRVSGRHFAPSTGYGYGDDSRDTLDKVFAMAFDAESAIVSPMLASGTHALSTAFFGLLRPNDLLLSVTGKPYDTLMPVINGADGSLADYGVKYAQIELKNGKPNLSAIRNGIKKYKPKVVFLQRSRGYDWRQTSSIQDISEIVNIVREADFDGCIMVDNCYGEFTMEKEPCAVGADIAVGSLIKNPGGGLAPTGGYVVGRKEYVDKIADRLTAPGIGREVGSYAGDYRPFYQGLFMAPHTVAQALKGSALFGVAFEELGYETLPKAKTVPNDITRAVKFCDKDILIKFCQNIQASSPIDGFAVLFPWDMPGYEDQVIMAAGAFVQGSSIELSCDAPIREPYIAYLQGGLTYEHVKIALENCLKVLIK